MPVLLAAAAAAPHLGYLFPLWSVAPFVIMLIGIAAVLASIIGTTGASMLLVRPLLRANSVRSRKAHVFVFFIFVVANAGGLLTPMGDPPLFLGFLRGVPFTWTLRLWRPWLLANGVLLVLFYLVDSTIFRAEA